MSIMTYCQMMKEKPLRLIQSEIKTPPFSEQARIIDGNKNWRVVYSIERDAILILEVFLKKTQTTPKDVIDKCRKRLSSYRSC